MIYRHKPFEVAAKQYDGTPESNRAIIAISKTSKTRAFMDRSGPKVSGGELLSSGKLMFENADGKQQVFPGDYIVTGKDGAMVAMPQEYFEATYEPLLPMKPTMPLYGLDGTRLN